MFDASVTVPPLVSAAPFNLLSVVPLSVMIPLFTMLPTNSRPTPPTPAVNDGIDNVEPLLTVRMPAAAL